MPALNKYIENVQTMLQANPTDSDALLYFPMEDVWHANNGSGKLHTLELHANSREWLKNTSFGQWAGLLQDKGFSVDYISDELMSDLELTPGKTFKTRGGDLGASSKMGETRLSGLFLGTFATPFEYVPSDERGPRALGVCP
jgi:hypothetical protein